MESLLGHSPARSRWLPVILLLLLAAGATAHFGHHLLDPDCDSDPRPTHATCLACSALHGGVALGAAAEPPVLGAPQHASASAPVDAAPALATPRLFSSRAPPAVA